MARGVAASVASGVVRELSDIADRLPTDAAEETGLVELGDVCIHYRRLGPGRGPAALILHGLMAHAWEWEILARRLATTHDVVIPDLRGHGFSEWSADYSAGALVDEAIALLDHLRIDAADVVGSSIGGSAAMLLAARRPDLVDHLVLVESPPDAFETGRIAERFLDVLRHRAWESFASVDEAVGGWLVAHPRSKREYVLPFLQRSLVGDGQDRLIWAFDALGLAGRVGTGIEGPVLWGAIDDLVAPTLVIRGHASDVFPRATADQMIDRLLHPHGLVEVGGASHDLAFEAPIAVAHHCCEFLTAPL